MERVDPDPGATSSPDTGGAGADPLVGRLLDGRYRLSSRLARGGMATVYLGLDERLERPVAVKVMHRALADDPDFVARFAREARSAARLSAPEVVAVYDTGRDEETGAAYLVMEHVAGRDLRAVLHDRGALPPGRALQVLEPVLRALAAAHRAGLVHRDVKPENILLGDDGRIKVVDFGLARAVETSELTATTGLLIGTVAYLAPEQVERGTADARTDVYAAGIVLWEMLTGTPPYRSGSPLTVAYRHVHDDVPPPSQIAGPLPAGLDELVLHATRRDPALRPADAGAFHSELWQLRERLPAPAARTDTLVVPRQPTSQADRGSSAPTRAFAAGLFDASDGATAPPSRRRRRGPLAALLVLLLALGVGGGSWYAGQARWTTAPGVLELTGAAAAQTLQAAGLASREQPARFDEDVPAGHVLDQEPDPGKRVRKGAAISLVLSKGPDRRKVPELVGSTEAAAGRSLEAVGLELGEVTRSFSSRPKGTVLSSRPAAGRSLRPGTAVALVVSKGLDLRPVPQVTGQARAAAEQAVRKAGLRVAVEEAFDEQVAAGRVVRQTPAAGGTAPRGSTVRLVLSKGPQLVVVPELRGLAGDAAGAALAALGLVAAPEPPALFSAPTVTRQDPLPGTRVPRGSAVSYGF